MLLGSMEATAKITALVRINLSRFCSRQHVVGELSLSSEDFPQEYLRFVFCMKRDSQRGYFESSTFHFHSLWMHMSGRVNPLFMQWS